MSKRAAAADVKSDEHRSAVRADPHPEPPASDDPRLDAWRAFLYAQSTVMPTLDAEMRSEVGVTLAEFDALAQLSFARDRRLRMSDLADRVLLSRSGVTRMVDRLAQNGYVRRDACAPDGRGFYAVLTDDGFECLRRAMPAHLAAVDAHFMQHVDDRDAGPLIRALGTVARANGRPVPSPARSAAALGRLTEDDREG